MKKKKTLIIISIIIVIIIGIILFYIFKKQPDEYINYTDSNSILLTDYQEYLRKYDAIFSDVEIKEELSESDFVDYNYILVSYSYNSCGEIIDKVNSKLDHEIYKIYYEVSSKCGVCEPYKKVDVYKVPKDEKIDDVKVFYKITDSEPCNINVAYKPIIYIYPEEDMDLTIKLGRTQLLLHTYPKYNKEWNIHVSKNSNIYDYNTNRNYYSLYWEAIDNSKIDLSKGFVVKGSDTVSFLEQKLSLLGLNEREINEFVIYWIDKLENNKYNYIHFRTTEEMNRYMPLNFSVEPDTLIRVMMDYKALEIPVKVEEQDLKSVIRNGFSVVEWGGRIIK